MTTINTIELLKLNNTQFEEISNEIIYEIFEYLDIYYIYQGFSDLNIRFSNLLYQTSLPLDIDISFLSKSNLISYHTNFILPNINRIHSLRLWSLSMLEYILSSDENIKQFIQIKSLVLDLTISNNIFDRLIFLPKLSSLIINQTTCLTNNGYINCNFIFSLSTLKYFKISSQEHIHFDLSSNIPSKSNSLEHLVINGGFDLYELPRLLLFLPHLSRLSINYLHCSNSNLKGKLLSQIPNKLTHVNLTLKNVKFNQFESFLINLFHHIQVFRISTNFDREYLNANRWERIISSSIPDLRIFDIQHLVYIRDENLEQIYNEQIKNFSSSFWKERGWYFQQQNCEENIPKYSLFFSIRPYKRRDYLLYGKYHQDGQIENQYHSVRHVHIQNQLAINDCSILFPNTDELTISFDDRRRQYSITSDFDQFIQLDKIHKINIHSNRFYFVTLIQMLYSTPNCSELIINSLLLENQDLSSIRHNPTFLSVSNTNKITDIIFKTTCTFKQLKLLVKLCPRIQHLNINVSEQEFSSIMKLLFPKSNEYVQNLVSLYIQTTKDIYIEKLMNLLDPSGQDSNKFVIETIGYYACHIWC